MRASHNVYKNRVPARSPVSGLRFQFGGGAFDHRQHFFGDVPVFGVFFFGDVERAKLHRPPSYPTLG